MFLAVAPIVASFVVTWLTAPALPRPDGALGTLVYVAGAAAVGTTTALLATRAANRFVPLATLLRLTLIFPDRAPSRFRLALRTGTVRQLRRALAEGAPVLPSDHQAAAERLIALTAELGRHERLTRGHSDRVRAYADLIGAELGLPPSQRQKLTWAAMVHDIGKLAVPADILNKTGPPTDVEWAILAQHPIAGAELVEPLAGWLGDWRRSACDHHERWDGTGYPNGLAGKDISLAGRIVAVADAYDTMTSNRSYQQAMSTEDARAELVRCSGSHFDPRVVRALLDASLPNRVRAVGMIGWLAALLNRSELAPVVRTAAAATTAAAITTGAGLAPVGAGPLDLGPADVLEAVQRATEPPEPVALPFAEPVGGPEPNVGPTQLTAPPTDVDGGAVALVENTTAAGEPAAPTTTTIDEDLPPSAPTTTTTQPTTPPTTAPPATTPPTTAPPPSTSTAPPTTTTAVGPTAVDDAVDISHTNAVLVDVLANDVAGSAPIDAGSLRIVEEPNHAALVDVNGSHRIQYKPTSSPLTDSLRYEICDVDGRCDTASLTITVAGG